MKKKLTPTRIFSLMTIIAASLLFGSCNKGSSVQTSDAVTETDAAQITTDAVMPTTGGVADQSTTTAALYAALPPACGITKDSTLTKASLVGTTPVYAFTFIWSFSTVCNSSQPLTISADYSFTGKGSYAGTYITASHTGNGQFVLTNFIDSSAYTLNGTYIRNGSFASKFVHPHAFTSTITITSANVKVDKVTKEIVSGTSTVTVAATSASGKNYNFTGTITYLGNKKANLVLNSGISHLIQWL